MVFPSFFHATAKLYLRWPDDFFLDLCREGVLLLLYGVIGVLFLRLFVRLPRLLEIGAGVFVGIGLVTFILELFAIGFWLNRFTVLLVFAGLIGGLLALRHRYGWSTEVLEPAGEPLSEPLQRTIFWSAVFGLSAMTALSFYHALLFPVDYWDALIYYVHYGKMTYEQGGFPIRVCLQVGLGLGANYPHLYPLHQAITATLFGHWSDLYGQFLCPFAGLISIGVIYSVALHLWKNRLIAVLSTLAFRSIPLISSYLVWESDYALVVAYTSLFLLFLAGFLEKRSIRGLQPLVCIAAIFPHINYLGWIVWPCLGLAIVLSRAALWANRRSLILIFLTLVFWFGWGLTWYVRNWVVTGNPVYAFFPTIFGGKNINLEVLASCNQEWLSHGNGVAHLGNTLWERILRSPAFILTDTRFSWLFAPLLGGIMIPSFLLGWRKQQAFFWISGLLVALYVFYEYVISGFFLYHILAIFPILGLFVGRFLAEIKDQKVLTFYGILLLGAAMVPGLSFSIMGPKNPKPILPIFAYPGMDKESFYRIVFPEYASTWQYLNEHAEPGAGVLTHDNRYHVFRDDLKIIHLDDCNLVPFYGKPYPEIHQYLWKQGIRYYLFIADELTHPITQRLGHASYLANPKYFELLWFTDQARLYRLKE